ncbi:hypothetical protein [Agriterribacter sp.]|uniref:hypothetical protein n=1 Tax=Agriterribacter sp. TaxID=2821509 RepID=UPI002C0506A5|nr:hypothetical protein [Agriterribacter sp.]HRP55314.1 hypothetical protein [Agriterribacter sp.]
MINPRNCRIDPRICCPPGSRFVLMIEVFKTNVHNRHDAAMLIEQIHRSFLDYQANFDLEDCDRILRVKCISGVIKSALLIDFLKDLGFEAEVLPDNIPVTGRYPLKQEITVFLPTGLPGILLKNVISRIFIASQIQPGGFLLYFRANCFR